MSEREAAEKLLAAQAAVGELREGMIVGLGSGTTAAIAVRILGEKVRAGFRITGIPTSENTEQQARSEGIPLTTLSEHPQIDVTIDGADEVETGSLNLVKGLGGALLREKLVASVSRRLLIMVDESKIVDALGSRGPVPVEVVPFGWEITSGRLEKLGAAPKLRRDAAGQPYISDGGHYILDCSFVKGCDFARLASDLDHILCVVEHGLFLGMASAVYVGSRAGVRVLRAHG